MAESEHVLVTREIDGEERVDFQHRRGGRTIERIRLAGEAAHQAWEKVMALFDKVQP